MPGFDGFDFLSWLRAHSPDHQRLLPVIVMSSFTEPADIENAYALGISVYVQKPLDFNQLKRFTENLCTFWAEYAETPAIKPDA